MGLALRNLGAGWGLPVKEREECLWSRLAKPVKKALNYIFCGTGTSIHPAPTSLMLVSAGDAWREIIAKGSAKLHLESSKKDFQPVDHHHQGPD